jgi:tripartite-type tricarboxylate transporter receptor subunit TctC
MMMRGYITPNSATGDAGFLPRNDARRLLFYSHAIHSVAGEPFMRTQPFSLIVCLAPSLVALNAFNAFAQDKFPTRPIRLVVPYPPGGGADFTGRELAQKLTEAWGQQVVVDNRPGAATAIGHNLVAKSPPDGYTLGLGSGGGMVVNPVMGTKLPYDSPKDFTAIGHVVSLPFILAVSGSLPVSNVRELITLAKAQPGKINFASPGAGTPNHLGGEMFKMMAAINLVHVAYKGAAIAATDLASGAIQLFFSSVPGVAPFMRSGRVKAIAAATPERFRGMPDLPTIAETLPGFDCSSWYGLIGPAGMPKALVARMNADLNRILANAEFGQRLMLGGVEPMSGTPDAMQRFIASEQKRWAAVIRSAGITAEVMR